MEWRDRLSSVYVLSALGETYLVYWYSIDLLSIRMGVHVPSVYVYSAICETYVM